MQKESAVEHGTGNSETVPQKSSENSDEKEKKKQGTQRKKWIFTYNNYKNYEVEQIKNLFKRHCASWGFGKEVAPNTGTKHLQGWFCLKKRDRITGMMKYFRYEFHYEPMYGSIMDNINYCGKEDEYFTNLKEARKIKWPEKWYPWQEAIIHIVKNVEPDNRTIYWFWDAIGGQGKTTLVKYLFEVLECTLVPNKNTDAMHAIAKILEPDKKDKNAVPGVVETVIFDVPRCQFNFLNYGVIEKVKDGICISGKYDGACAVFACPHVFVFANTPPDFLQMSLDRWQIYDVSTGVALSDNESK